MLLIKILLIIQPVFGKLPELSTKQSIDNIRFISSDGKATYYQLRSGALSLSANYENKLIFKNEMGAQYEINSSEDRKYISVTVNKNMHKNMNLMKNKEIHVIPYKSDKPVYIGAGVNPQFQLGSQWVSFYDMVYRTIVLSFIKVADKEIEIPMINKINPFFIPDVIMVNPEIVLYTDINTKGQMGIMKYNTVSGDNFALVKSPVNGVKLEMCKKGNKIVVGQFSYPGMRRGSSIYTLDLDQSGTAGNKKELYSSPLEDIGGMACQTFDDNIYFIKQIKEKDRLNTEVAQLNLKNGRLEVLSKLKFASQVISMDGRIITPFRDKIYVVKGKSNLGKDVFKK
jgi:hypothetical protein